MSFIFWTHKSVIFVKWCNFIFFPSRVGSYLTMFVSANLSSCRKPAYPWKTSLLSPLLLDASPWVLVPSKNLTLTPFRPSCPWGAFLLKSPSNGAILPCRRHRRFQPASTPRSHRSLSSTRTVSIINLRRWWNLQRPEWGCVLLLSRIHFFKCSSDVLILAQNFQVNIDVHDSKT